MTDFLFSNYWSLSIKQERLSYEIGRDQDEELHKQFDEGLEADLQGLYERHERCYRLEFIIEFG